MQIVALHGQMGLASDWDGLTAALAQAQNPHVVSAVDLWELLDLGDLTLENFAKRFNAEQESGQILMGYSMGGRLALHALLDEPRKWRAAVIVSAHLGLREHDRAQRQRADAIWAEKVLSSPWKNFLEEWNAQTVLKGDVMPDRLGLEAYREEIARSFRCWGLGEQAFLLDKLSQFDIPVLWVVGKRDHKFSKQGKLAANALRNVELCEISDAGHRVPWEAESEFTVRLLDWLDRV